MHSRRAGRVWPHVDALLVRIRPVLVVMDHHPRARLLGQLVEHVVVLVQKQLDHETFFESSYFIS